VISAPEDFAAHCVAAAVMAEPRLVGEASLLLTDDQDLHRLNLQFRGKDYPTNVLSFPAGDDIPGFAGDIAIAFETCAREADERGLPFGDHAAHLIVHGLLHLIGYDHETDEQATDMEGLETRVLAQIGIDDPYAHDCEQPDDRKDPIDE
jgi:probable rRNA maturation factor